MGDAVYETNDTKNILMSSNAYLTMRKNLEKNIGKDKTKGFLFRFGKQFGEEAAKNYFEKKTRSGKVGKMHVRMGHVKDVTFDGRIIRHPDGTVECENAVGKWIESFEAGIQMKELGSSEEPVCHTLCGFASGALSYEFGVSLIALETHCVAKGDDCCAYEVRLKEDWLDEREEIIDLYESDNILLELEMTYDALLQHKKLLEQLSVFQTELTQNVTERYSMNELVEQAYRLLQIPLIVEDVHGQLLTHSGLREDQLVNLSNPTTVLFQRETQNITYTKGSDFYKLSSRVSINKKHYATCSFIYEKEHATIENDAMFLEKIASVIALCILYEEAQFEEQQRMKSSIIERLIHQQNIASIEASFKFLPFKFSPPYTVATIDIRASKKSMRPVDYYEQLVQLSRAFEKWRLPTIIAVIGEELVLLTSHSEDADKFNATCKKVVTVLAEKQQYVYDIGVSRSFTAFTEFEQALKESRIARRFENKQLITNYDDLGILGDLVTNMTVPQIHDLSAKILKGLYNFSNPRTKELLYTLYIFLLNNQRLKETMEFLNLSIGGIQYRIRQIEQHLDDTLKNASLSAYALLLIQALLLLGELSFED